MIHIAPHVLDQIRRHGQEGYPDEACGFLLGREDGGRRTIVEAEPAPNEYEGSRRRRFLIHPKEVMEAERRADERGLLLLGFYHSHPDHPAAPSEFDRAHAWPWFSYLVLAVEKGTPTGLTAWRLRDDATRFDEEALAPA